jgi:hypothetical protein
LFLAGSNSCEKWLKVELLNTGRCVEEHYLFAPCCCVNKSSRILNKVGRTKPEGRRANRPGYLMYLPIPMSGLQVIQSSDEDLGNGSFEVNQKAFDRMVFLDAFFLETYTVKYIRPKIDICTQIRGVATHIHHDAECKTTGEDNDKKT